jgi:TetR/AcrR family transcriptional repressor of nem operon
MNASSGWPLHSVVVRPFAVVMLWECVVKVTRKRVAENRQALVATARKLLKERGFDGAGVVDISREAGLTQGALYGKFKSKDGLTAEALSESINEGAAFLQQLRERTDDVIGAYLDFYVSQAHVKDVGSGCIIAACISDICRQNDAVGKVFADGLRRFLKTIQGLFPEEIPPEVGHDRAIALLSAMIGSVAIARAVQAADPSLSQDIIAAARKELEEAALRSFEAGEKPTAETAGAGRSHRTGASRPAHRRG